MDSFASGARARARARARASLFKIPCWAGGLIKRKVLSLNNRLLPDVFRSAPWSRFFTTFLNFVCRYPAPKTPLSVRCPIW